MNRETKINSLIASIQKHIREKKKNPDKKDIILSAMANLGLARRTAIEYVEVACYKMGIELDESSTQ